MFLLDANVFIQAARTYYSFENVPGFWEWLESETASGYIRTVLAVKNEVEYPERLSAWMAESDREPMYVDESDPAIQAKMSEIATWVVGQPFGPEHIASFLSGADPWIIAAAMELDATVVTQEISVPSDSKKIKIPNVCAQFDVPAMNTFDVMRELGAVFQQSR